MRIGLLVLYVSSALGGRYAVAQDVTRQRALSAACIEFNQTAHEPRCGRTFEGRRIHAFRGLGRPDKRLRAIVWLADTAQPGNRHGLIGAARGSRGP